MTNEKLENMDVYHYQDVHSPIVGFGLENGERLYIFYVDGYTQVIESVDVGAKRFEMVVDAAMHGHSLEYLGGNYCCEIEYDTALTAVAYLDYLAQHNI